MQRKENEISNSKTQVSNNTFFSPATKPLLRGELSQENQNQPDQALSTDVNTDNEALNTKSSGNCSYTVKYGNPRLLPVPTCGGAVQFDILQVQS